jgi:hypothetical protein
LSGEHKSLFEDLMGKSHEGNLSPPIARRIHSGSMVYCAPQWQARVIPALRVPVALWDKEEGKIEDEESWEVT